MTSGQYKNIKFLGIVIFWGRIGPHPFSNIPRTPNLLTLLGETLFLSQKINILFSIFI